ncbi:MAG: virginiamycin B lyase, partial [Thermoleophilia bacterium]|nr:virginiamycin B lyase [Thermoleophilia bacterium]
MSPDGLAATFPLPGVGQIHYIAADARGDIWFGEFGGRVGRLTLAGGLTMYPK